MIRKIDIIKIIDNIMSFLTWWENKLTYSLGFLVFTHWAQIPHFLWGGDALAMSGTFYQVNPFLDFILYSIDLIEIPAIIAVTLSFISKIRHKI